MQIKKSILALSSALALTAASTAARAQEAPKAPPAKPNIIFMMLDDVGYNGIEPFGTSYDMPFARQMAKEGMIFTQCHSRATCGPSRQVLLTGKTLSRGDLKGSNTSFASILKTAGYSTAVAGKWMLGEMNMWERGFDESLILVNGYRFWNPDVVVANSGGYLKEYNLPKLETQPSDYGWIVEGVQPGKFPGAARLKDEYGPEVTNRFVLDFITRHKDKPFCVYYPMKLGHGPHMPTPFSELNDKDRDDKRKMQEFAGKGDLYSVGHNKFRPDLMHYADMMLGRVLQTLKENGLDDNTMVVFTSDNGPGVPGKAAPGFASVPGIKGGILDGATRVPTIVRWPKVVKAGTRYDHLVDFTDFLPTFAAMGGATLPPDEAFDGQSFLPQLRGEKGQPREWIYFGGGSHPVEWDRLLKDIVDYPQPDPWSIRYVRGDRYKLYGDGRFYDLETDINEKTPLAPTTDKPQAQAARREFRAVLDRYTKVMGGKPDPVYTYRAQ